MERIFREESGRILATLIRLLGSFDLAEEFLQEAFTAALEVWPQQGMPANPRAWLVSTAQHKAVDALRRRATFDAKREELQKIADLQQQLADADEHMRRHHMTSGDPTDNSPQGADPFGDDRLRLIFTCCHPALATEAQVALTLRTLCGLTTDEIARGFLVPLPTMAQRLVRAKQKIRDANIPYQIPPERDLPIRIDAVLLVVYLVFNEGYSATSGDTAIRQELCAEAIRLGRILHQLLPRQTEVRALLALMLLHDSRRAARTNDNGEPVLLEDQSRERWNQEQIREGLALIESALQAGPPGPYALQASIAAVHSRAPRPEETDWRQIVALYDLLLQMQRSPVIELNRAAAVAMAEGPATGLRLLDALETSADLREYYLLPAARADLLRRQERWPEAAESYRRALALATNAAAQKFLSRRLSEMESKAP
ncbi:MAG TPA: RNA polymerase sigma factor [Candidatus Sulfotelmatobacter sp.]|jgi:RNA polymerase sigma-70 factor (ECF subfamily)|nr:RNA polymerase sigma factor [Candidatus Sulfotelmatobacter sp.]